MQEIPDNELDNLFRKSLSSSAIPFDEKAWNSMEKKLEDEERRKAFYWRISGGIASLLLLFIFYIVTFNNSTDIKEQSIASSSTLNGNNIEAGKQSNITAQVKANKQVYRKEDSKGNSDENIAKLNKLNILNTKTSDSYIENKKGSLGSLNANKISYLTSKTSGKISTGSNTIRNNLSKSGSSGNIDNSTLIQNKEAYNNIISLKRTDTISNTDNIRIKQNETFIPINNDITSIENNEITTSAQNKTDSTDNSAAQSEKTAETTNTTIENKPIENNTIPSLLKETAYTKKETSKDSIAINTDSITKTPLPILAKKDTLGLYKKKNHFLSLNFIINPEFSTGPNFDFYKPGLNTGAMAEYYFSSRLSIAAGGLYSIKRYTAEGYEYKPEHNYWPHHKTPSQVIATCNIVEVPIIVRYKFLKRGNYNVYVTSGLLSYIMHKENYNYIYSPGTNTTGLLTSKEIINKNRYFFSVYTASIGIERYINQAWSIQIEPYMQLPLSGVGEGKITLISSGAYFTLKHYFPFRKKGR